MRPSTTSAPLACYSKVRHRQLIGSSLANKLSRMGSFFAGHVSRTTLLTRLLPLSFASFCITVGIGILLFPGDYQWKKHVLSSVISPRQNPAGYWVPSIGLAVTALLALPFAGYVAQRLRAITPRLARCARLAFTVGFLLVLGIVVPQHTEPVGILRRLHPTLACVSAAATSFGVVCCCLYALRDACFCFGGRQSLRRRLVFCWASITLLPFICGVLSGVMMLARKAGHGWALHSAAALRSTMLWQLAFWEWAGVVTLFTFLFLSVLWLPEQWERKWLPVGEPWEWPRFWPSRKAMNLETAAE